MVLNLIFVVVLLICLYTDVRYQLIFNKVLLPAVVSAFILSFAYYGVQGLESSLEGLAVGFVLLLVPFLMGGIGAGDVKLLALVGAFKGVIFVVNSAIYMGLIGGVISLGIVILCKQMLRFLKDLRIWIRLVVHRVFIPLELQPLPLKKKFPYGIAIVGGALICLISKGAWFI